MRTSSSILLAALGAASLLLAGCAMDLDGRSRQYSKYDPAQDEFHFLWTCTDLVASRAPIESGAKKLSAEEHRQVGLEHLENLWKQRANVVMMPGPFGPIAFIRKENRLLETVSLFKRDDEGKPFTTQFDLTPIRVLPGEMFLSPHGTLCYTHHCIFPGATIDKAFQLAVAAINPEVEKSSRERLAAREKGEQKRVAWDDFRTERWKGVEQGQRFNLVTQILEKFPEALDDASLRSLAEQGSKQQITLRREKMKFTARMNLSPDDAREFCLAIETALRGELPDPSKNIPAGQPDPYARQKDLEARANIAFRESHAICNAAGEVTIAVEMLAILKLLEEEGGPWGFYRDKSFYEMQRPEAKADAAEVEKRKIPVSRTAKLEQVLQEFRGAEK